MSNDIKYPEEIKRDARKRQLAALLRSLRKEFNPTDMNCICRLAGFEKEASRVTGKPRLDGHSNGEDDSKAYLFGEEITDEAPLDAIDEKHHKREN